MNFVCLVGQDDIAVVHHAAPSLQRGRLAAAAAHRVGPRVRRDAGCARGGAVRTRGAQAAAVQGVIATAGREHGVQDPGGLRHPWASLRNPRVFCLQPGRKLQEQTGESEKEEGKGDAERRELRGPGPHRRPSLLHRKSKNTPGPAQRELVFPWQLRPGKPVLRSCPATEAAPWSKRPRRPCRRTLAPLHRCRPTRVALVISQHLSVLLCKMGRQEPTCSLSSGPWFP